MAETDSERIARIDERTAHMARRLDDIAERVGELCSTQVDHGQRIARVETRVGVVGAIAAALSVIAGALGVSK